MNITNRYGVRVKGEIVPYGTNILKNAQTNAEMWKGEVVDLAAIGRKMERHGEKVVYTYRK